MRAGKKRDGMRLPTKPDWTIWNGDRGIGISRTAARFANWLLGNPHDMNAIEARVTAAYEAEIKSSKGWL